VAGFRRTTRHVFGASDLFPLHGPFFSARAAAESDLREWLLLAGTMGELENLMASAF
jgi:hypothetical protein